MEPVPEPTEPNPSDDQSQPPQSVMFPGGMDPKPTRLPHLVVIETVVWRPPYASPPPACEHKYPVLLTTDDRPYGPREHKNVGPEWVKLDFGWIIENGKKPSMIVIANLRPPRIVYPTEEEIEDDRKKVVEVTTNPYGDDADQNWLIPPGQNMRGMPGGEVWVRCRHKTTTVEVTVFPA